MAPSPVVILALESSAGQATAAISVDGDVVCQTSHTATHGHAAWMVPLAQDAVAKAKLDFDQLTHIIAGRGPGSFTGIRVALAAAKGLAMSLNIGATGLSSLSGMAAAAQQREDAAGRHIITTVDSRRGTVFFQEYAPNGQAVSDIMDGTQDTLAEHMKGIDAPIVIAGHDADAIAAMHQDALAFGDIAPEAASLLMHHHLRQETILYDGPCFTDIEPLYLSAPLLGPRGS